MSGLQAFFEVLAPGVVNDFRQFEEYTHASLSFQNHDPRP
jgi:hypothetical protein